MPFAPDAATVPLLSSDEAFVEAAQELAARLRPGAIPRDRESRFPRDELRWLRRSGLLALPVPYGLAGARPTHETRARVFAILAAADPSFAQLLQPHVTFVDAVGRGGSADQKRCFFAEAANGRRFANAVAERGTPTAVGLRARLTREGAPAGAWRLNGRKYYSTGALDADWIAVLATADEGAALLAYVPGGTTGVAVEQDWTAFGQRSTFSGTTVLTDVIVPDKHVIDPSPAGDQRPTTFAASAQLLHGAIDQGIARGALRDGVAFVREHARPPRDAAVERAADDPHLQWHYGRLDAKVEAAETLLLRAASLLDVAEHEPTQEAITAARLGVAKAKAFAGEVAEHVANDLFEGTGSAGTDARYDLDRHWRNARTHTLHDGRRWKYLHAGRWLLTGDAPDPGSSTI